MTKILEIDGLTKKYPGFTLDHVSFEMKAGEIMGFIGRNGAGKSTTMKSLLNFVHPNEGKVKFFGLPFPEEEMDIKQRIGFVAGGIDYYPKKKLKTITKVTSTFFEKWDNEAYKYYIDKFQLDENKTPDQLSAGMKVKYSLALALSHHAELLMLDEPTSGLDPVSREEILEIFLGLADKGIAILFSTHITSDLEKCADTITYIKSGKVIRSCDEKSFIATYRICQIGKDELTQELQEKMIGRRMMKDGYTVLVHSEDAENMAFSFKEPTLDEIMVHLEAEEEGGIV